ncbi:S41 family peptidase [Chitinophaga sp. LS1]|uniref:S41 family peptidase n=1 Tax=Chitinophaga sp. LS1 TaxID=3051176 RepID=UPI002AABFB9C|nr:S41 family peptidase [Chitinophaga sp. LS1]WPV67537.1 S41 family peptidase [Chitinophaga sp. LS1]
MQRIILLLIICNVFLCLKLKAQECNCSTNLDTLISDIENNYVGFNIKTKEEKAHDYKTLIKTLRAKSHNSDHYKCYLLLTEYANFFNDPHLKVLTTKLGPTNKYYDSLKIMFSKLAVEHINLDSIINYYHEHDTNNTLEGIWSLPEFNYKIVIVKTNTAERYKGIVIKADNFKWYKGQVKMVLSGKNPYNIQFYIADHTQRNAKALVENNTMNLGELGTWRKEQKGIQINSDKEDIIYFKYLSSQTSLLRIGSCDIRLRDTINEIIGKNWKEITGRNNLIIDIRNNTGGSIMTLDTLIRLFYIKPILTDGLYIKSSKENILLYTEALNNPEFNDKEKRNFQEVIDSLRAHLGEITLVSKPDSIVLNGTVNPKKIAIITNSRTGSAAELFTLYAKQSNKVIVVGEHTNGALDYTELGRNRNLPCPMWQYICPMGMSTHIYKPLIDNIGIIPDQKIPYNIDWIKWTQKYLEYDN